MASFNYIALLGRQPELGFVELEALFGASVLEAFGRGAALLCNEPDIGRLGGTVKVGRIIWRGPTFALAEMPIDTQTLPMRESKTPFALSAYGVRESARAAVAAGLTLKRRLKSRGSVRFVAAASGLSATAAEIRHNRVLEDGFELLVVAAGREMIVAQTTGVQDVDWYSKRDYGRPRRDAKVGMLPPKLAQVLVNTAGAGSIWDPFCGTGVILQESLLLGRPAAGSDLSPVMVDATRKNLMWLEAEVRTPLPAWRAELADARTAHVPGGSAVASEGYLGPNLSGYPGTQKLSEMKRELSALYRDCLKAWARDLAPGTNVSLCAPAWREGRQWVYLDLVDGLANLGYTLRVFEYAVTPFVYAREGQVVGRQLLFLRKQ